MTQKELALELIPKYEKEIILFRLQERYLQRKVISTNDRNWQLSLGKAQAQLKESKEFLEFLNEICEESSDLECVDKEKPKDTSKKL